MKIMLFKDEAEVEALATGIFSLAKANTKFLDQLNERIGIYA